MSEMIRSSAYFGFVLSLSLYFIAFKTYKKIPIPLFSPLLFSSVLIILILVLFDIEYEIYEKSASLLNIFMGPATICYAVPLYRQVKVLKQHFGAIMISVFCGCITSFASVYILSRVFQFDAEIYKSILPKSITTPIGISVSDTIGGIAGITVASIIITGIFGGAMAVVVCRIFKVTHPIAKGLAIGTSSHVIGTSKAVEIGDVEGAMSGLALVIAGILTVLLAPFAALLPF